MSCGLFAVRVHGVILASAVLVSRQALINHVNILLSDFLEYNAKQIGDTDEIDNEE